MSKNQKSVKGLENIGQVATALKEKAAAHFLPDLSMVLGLAKRVQSSVEDTDLQEKRREATQMRAEQLRAIGTTIGQALGSENPEMEIENVRNMENGILSFFQATDIAVIARQLAREFITSLLEAAPATSDALAHIGTMGTLIGYLRKDSNGVILPIATEIGGRWTREGVSVPHGDEAVGQTLRAKVKLVDDAQKQERNADKDSVRDGAGELLDVLAQKSGEAVFFVPPSKNEKTGKWYPSAHVRVRVESDKIYPVTATGKTAGIVERAAGMGLYLFVSQMGESRLNLKNKLPAEEFGTLLTFHSLCHRGMKLAKENALQKKTVEAMKAKATCDLAEFVLRNAKGLAYIHFSEWTAGYNDEAVAYKNVSALVERNKDGELRILAHLAAHERLFKDCREPMASLEKYAGVAYPLGNMLRKLYAILSNKERRADGDGEGDGQPQPATPTETPKLEPEPQTPAPKEEEFKASEEQKAKAVAALRAARAASAPKNE